MPAFLIQIDAFDPAGAGSPVTLRASSVDDDRICMLDAGAGGPWWPAVAKLPALRYDLVDGALSGQISTPGSVVSLTTEPWPNFPRFSFAGARVRIWSGEPGDAWPWTLRFDGRATGQPRVADGRAEIPFAVDDRWLNEPLLATYAGTGGIEGEPSLKGQPKRLALGAPRYAGGTMIDSTSLVVQLSAYGAIEDVEAAFEKVGRFAPAVSDHATLAQLLAAAVPAGRIATSKALGLVRHGAPPVGKLSYHLKGDKAAGWARLPGALISRIAAIAGASAKVHQASLAALDVSRPWPTSWIFAEQITRREAIQRIAASVNAAMGVDWLGKLFVVPLAINAPTVTLDATGASLPPVARVAQLEVDPPFWRMAIESEKTWELHALSDVAFTAKLDPLGLYDPARTYREGQMVELPNGSEWLYINATPAAGQAQPAPTFPPAPPASNAHWQQMRPPIAGPDIGVAAGATRNVIYRQVTDPVGGNEVQNGDIWVDISSAPMIQKIRIGNSWQAGANYVTEGSHIGVANGATRNLIYRQAGAPASPNDGDEWIDISVTPNVTMVRVAGAWQPAANLVTEGSQIGVENGATLGDNLLQNAGFRDGLAPATASGASAVSVVSAGAGDPGNYARFVNVGVGNAAFLDWPWEPVPPAPVLFFSAKNRVSNADFLGNGEIQMICEFRTAAGAALPALSVAAPVPAAVNTWRDLAARFEVPAGAAERRFRFRCFAPYGGSTCDVARPRLAVSENNADVTKTVSGPATASVTAKSDGTFAAGALPKISAFALVRSDGTDITALATWAATPRAASATSSIGVANGKAILSTTALEGTTTFDITASIGGVVVGRLVHTLEKAIPSTQVTSGGGSSGTSGGSTATAAMEAYTANSYVAATAVMKAKAGSGGKVACSAPLEFTDQGGTAGSSGLNAVWKWRTVGGAFADIAAVAASAGSAITVDNGGGEFERHAAYMTLNQTKEGLTDGIEYEFQLWAKSTTARFVDVYGANATLAQAVGS